MSRHFLSLRCIPLDGKRHLVHQMKDDCGDGPRSGAPAPFVSRPMALSIQQRPGIKYVLEMEMRLLMLDISLPTHAVLATSSVQSQFSLSSMNELP
jgi:hypothetical protein